MNITSVAEACFLPGRAKDLSHSYIVESTFSVHYFCSNDIGVQGNLYLLS